METFFFLIVGAVLFISVVLFYSIAQQQQNLKSQQTQTNNKVKQQKIAKPIKSALKHPQKETDTIAVPVVAAEEKVEVVATHVPKAHKEPHVKQQKSPKKVHDNYEHDKELLVLAKKNHKTKPVEEIKEEDKKLTAQEEEWRDAKKGQKAEVDGVKKKLADKEHELSNALKQIEELKKHLTETKTQLARAEKKET